MAASKRQTILDTALTLFVTQGVSGTSTASIAKQAGVATGTLFHHFPNKQVLVDELYRTIKQELAEVMLKELPEDPLAKAAVFWHDALDWFLDNPEKLVFFKLYYGSPLLSTESKRQAMQEVFGFLYDFFQQGQDAGIFVKLPLEFVVQNIQSNIFSTTTFIVENPEFNTAEFKQQTFELMAKSMLSA